METRTVIAGDFMAHSPYRNSLCRIKQRAEKPESLIDSYGLLFNSDFSVATRAKRTPSYSIIDLTSTTPDVGSLLSWMIDPEHATPPDHELIIFDIDSLNIKIGSLGSSTEITGWAIKDLTEDQKLVTQNMWNEHEG